MRVQLAAVSDADAALETVTAATAAVAREIGDPWRCAQCGTSETVCRRAGPSGNQTLCNGAFFVFFWIVGAGGGWPTQGGEGVVGSAGIGFCGAGPVPSLESRRCGGAFAD